LPIPVQFLRLQFRGGIVLRRVIEIEISAQTSTVNL
jgi:hypothetical protein